MSTQLQEIVDTLATQLDRAVAIDDPRLHLLAHSPHRESVDEVRMASIMNREAPAEVVDYALSVGINRSEGPVRIPANLALHMWSRMCVPIWCQGFLLGHLFFIDADETCRPDELVLAESAAHMAGMILYQQRLLREVETARERELLQDLLNGDLPLRQSVAAEVIERGLLEHDPTVAVLVAQPTSVETNPKTATSVSDLRFAVTTALEDVRHSISPRHSMQLDRPGQGVLLIDTHDVAVGHRNIETLASDLQAALTKRLATQGTSRRVVVGVSQPSITLVHAHDAYQQATTAARVASTIPSLGNVVSWSHLGIYQILSQMPSAALTKDTLHGGIRRLLDSPRHDVLVETLETYLDHAGNAAATAQMLSLHRTSLYYRIDKIEKLTGVDLGNGHDRLALHLSLKIARLSGLSGGSVNFSV